MPFSSRSSFAPHGRPRPSFCPPFLLNGLRSFLLRSLLGAALAHLTKLYNRTVLQDLTLVLQDHILVLHEPTFLSPCVWAWTQCWLFPSLPLLSFSSSSFHHRALCCCRLCRFRSFRLNVRCFASAVLGSVLLSCLCVYLFVICAVPFCAALRCCAQRRAASCVVLLKALRQVPSSSRSDAILRGNHNMSIIISTNFS